MANFMPVLGITTGCPLDGITEGLACLAAAANESAMQYCTSVRLMLRM